MKAPDPFYIAKKVIEPLFGQASPWMAREEPNSFDADLDTPTELTDQKKFLFHLTGNIIDFALGEMERAHKMWCDTSSNTSFCMCAEGMSQEDIDAIKNKKQDFLDAIDQVRTTHCIETGPKSDHLLLKGKELSHGVINGIKYWQQWFEENGMDARVHLHFFDKNGELQKIMNPRIGGKEALATLLGQGTNLFEESVKSIVDKRKLVDYEKGKGENADTAHITELQKQIDQSVVFIEIDISDNKQTCLAILESVFGFTPPNRGTGMSKGQ